LKAALKAKEYYEIRNHNEETATEKKEDYFFIKSDNKLVKIFFDEILFVDALQNYVTIHTTDHKYITYLTFKSVEEYLPTDRFIKTHKSISSRLKDHSIEGNDIPHWQSSHSYQP
jgi:DNA-binding LytR/AlgR family response regulator